MKLNAAQEHAVQHSGSPLLIVAGAGTGKTTVLIEKIKSLIQKQVDPQSIFATTFTEKSAEEMRARLDKIMPYGYQEPWIGTFHSLCDRLLSYEGLEIGLNTNYQILTQTDQWIFIRKNLFKFDLNYYRPLGNPNKFISAFITYLSRLKDEYLTPAEFHKIVKNRKRAVATQSEQAELERLEELAHLYSRYEELKAAAAVLDFGDLITHTIRLLETRPNLKSKYQKKFTHIFVDEFQDTNYAQYHLIKLLAPANENPNLVVVGDDDQSIYKFRGASVSNILEFKDDYPQAEEVVLDQNYRSTQKILDSAYQSIQHNNPDRLEAKLGINKSLKANSTTTKGALKLQQFETIDQEVDWTISQIRHLITKEGLKHQDIAILARANSHLEPYVAALKRAGIPYQLVSNRGLFDQPEVRLIITFLRVIVDPQDTLSLFQLSQSPLFNLDPADTLARMRHAKTKCTALWDELQNAAETLESDAQLSKFVTTISQFQGKLSKLSVTAIVHLFVNQTGLLKPFIEEESVENQLKIKNLNLFFDKLKQFERVNEDSKATTFLDVLDLWLEAGENPGQAQIEDIDTVSLMTVHAAKGLEFEAVFLGSVVAGRFPGYNRKDPIEIPDEAVKERLPEGDAHLQEERRLFYVALTRAKRYLYLTFAEDVGGLRKRKMSGFLKETGISISTPDTSQLQLPLVQPSKGPQVRYLKMGKYQINQVSFSQIDTFTTCPLQYKYRYLLQIPTESSHALSFGKTIHETLHQFHKLEMHGEQPELKELLSLYDANFIAEGYQSAEHRDKQYHAGVESLKKYFKKRHEHLGKPKLLEQSFQLQFGDTRFIGKIDRIDQRPDGTLEIIDYKTGTVKDQRTVDKSDQLSVYALAAKEALGLDIAQTSLYFMSENVKISSSRSQKDINKTKDKMSAIIDKMKTSQFPPKPSYFVCHHCPYNRICPAAATKG